MVGVASGVALVVAMASLLTSTTATANSVVDLLGGARYELVAPGGVRDEAITNLAATPGVTGVRRFVEAPVLVDGQFASLIAIDDSATSSAGTDDTPLATREARALAAIDGVRVGSGLPTAGTLRVTGITGVTVELVANGRVDSVIANRYGGNFIAAPMENALELRGIPAPDSVLIYGDPDVDVLKAVAVGEGIVQPVSARVEQARRTIQILFSSLSILGSMSLIVGGFLLFNTMNMAVLDRRHEIALLRALGSNRRSIRRGILAEAVLLGGIGSLVGVVLGFGMASAVIANLPDGFVRAIGVPLDVSVPLWLLASVWALGVVTALAGTIAPARRALRVDPLEALRPEVGPSDERTLNLRWVPLVGGVLLVLIAAFAGEDLVPPGLALGFVIPGLLAVVYGCAPLITRATGAIADRLGTSGQIAALSLERSPRRVWATTATVIVSIAICVTPGSANLGSTLSGRPASTRVLGRDRYSTNGPSGFVDR